MISVLIDLMSLTLEPPSSVKRACLFFADENALIKRARASFVILAEPELDVCDAGHALPLVGRRLSQRSERRAVANEQCATIDANDLPPLEYAEKTRDGFP